MKKKFSRLQRNTILCLLLIATTGCASLRQRAAFDHRDYVELPKGTLIKNVPFYLNGADKPPTYADYTTGSEGAFFSLAAEKVLK